MGAGLTLAQGYHFAVHPDTTPDGPQIVAVTFDKNYRRLASVITGEVIYQLRSSLDVGLNALARSCTDLVDTRHIYFPFVGTEAEFDLPDNAPRKLRGLPQGVYEVVRGLQPWTGGNEALIGLNKLRNEEVHNDLISASWTTSNLVRVDPHGGWKSALAGEFTGMLLAGMRDDSITGDWTVDVTRLTSDLPAIIDLLNARSQMSVYLTFKDTVAFAGESIVLTLQELAVVVQDVIGLLEESVRPIR